MSIEFKSNNISQDYINTLSNHELDNLTEEEISQFKYISKNKEVHHVQRTIQIIAEGDSWFDYPIGTDLIDWLRQDYSYSITNKAALGDTLENMIYGTSIDVNMHRLSPQLNFILNFLEKNKTKIFLFSGGGNDIAGNEFVRYLNHHNTGLPAIKKDYVKLMIRTYRNYLIEMIKIVNKVSPKTQIIMHGYGHTAPTGKGASVFIFNFSGPWLLPALQRKGITDRQEQREAVFFMIDAYNDMLQWLDSKFPTFHHLDLRKQSIIKPINPDNDWTNELHLKNSKYREVARLIDKKIQELI